MACLNMAPPPPATAEQSPITSPRRPSRTGRWYRCFGDAECRQWFVTTPLFGASNSPRCVAGYARQYGSRRGGPPPPHRSTEKTPPEQPAKGRKEPFHADKKV